MNKRQRLEAFFAGQSVDRTPCCFWRHYTPELERGEDVVEAHLKFYRETNQDVVKISSDGYFGWPARVLQNLEDVSALYHMDHVPGSHPYIREQVERAKAIVSALNGECFTFYTLFCPLSLFRLQVGWDKMMECVRQDPKAVMHASEVIAEDEMGLIQALIQEAGVDGIFYSVQNAEVTRFTLEEYKQIVEPSERKVMEFMGSLTPYNVMHCCGWDADVAGTHNHLESWQNYPCGAVSWASSVDKLDAKGVQAFFGKPTWGGFDNRKGKLLHVGTKEAIQAEARRLIEEAGNRGFMLGPDCSLPNDITTERIRWVVEAANE